MGIITLNILAQENKPPNFSGWLSVSLGYGITHTFTLDNFTTETNPPYADPENDALKSIQITSLPTQGEIQLSSIAVSRDDIITSGQLSAGALTYVSDSGETNGYSDGYMTFLVADVGSSIFTTSPKIVTFVVSSNVNQAPSQVGNGEADIGVGGTYIFTRASLTSQLNPPYEDPEGNPADKLLVKVVPVKGYMYLNGVLVVDGQEIDFSDIDSGLLTYVNEFLPSGSDLEGFEFEISDTGSGEYRG